MTALRVLSEEGITRFRFYIQNVKANAQVSRPDLSAEPYSPPFGAQVDIEETRSFATRMEMGQYLADRFTAAGLDRSGVLGNHGLWTWLSYFWFDQLCPEVDGSRKVRETARYVCSLDYTDYYRHYVAAAYDLFSLLGTENCRLFLSCPVNRHNDFVEQLASRQNIITSTCLIETVHHLYWHAQRGSAKNGASDRKRPGSLRRFIRLVAQLELTYDIYTMSPPEILSLLPQEFASWSDPQTR